LLQESPLENKGTTFGRTSKRTWCATKLPKHASQSRSSYKKKVAEESDEKRSHDLRLRAKPNQQTRPGKKARGKQKKKNIPRGAEMNPEREPKGRPRGYGSISKNHFENEGVEKGRGKKSSVIQGNMKIKKEGQGQRVSIREERKPRPKKWAQRGARQAPFNTVTEGG